MSQFKINLSTNTDPTPVNPVPVDPTPTINVPNTGSFSNDDSLALTSLFTSGIIILLVSIVIIASKLRRSHKIFSKHNSFKLNSKKQLLILPAALIITTLSVLCIKNSHLLNDETTIAAPGQTLSISTSDINMDITRKESSAAFNYVSDSVTVSSSTGNGYILGVYASNTNLQSENNSANQISSINTNNSVLLPNTWGVSLTKPENQNSKFQPMPTTEAAALIIKNTAQATPANDTTTIYYGVNIDPNLPDGLYSGVTINYYAVANIVTPIEYKIKFDANGGDGNMSDLDMTYGVAKNLTTNTFARTGYTFTGWNTDISGSGVAYVDNASVSNLTTVANATITLYAQWKPQTGKIHFINTNSSSNAFLIESNGRYGLVDASNPLYDATNASGDTVNTDERYCMNKGTCSTLTVEQVVNYLNNLGVESLDFVIGSHSHSDHIGGMPVIAQNFVNSNTKYYYREYKTTEEDSLYTGVNDWHNRDYYNRAINAMQNKGATLVETTNKESTFTLGDFSIKLLNTEEATGSELVNGRAKSENDNSIVALITLGDSKALLTSDMQIVDETKVANKTGKIDILQMGHHGKSTSTSDSFINVLQPKDVIIPTSRIDNKRTFTAIYHSSKTYNTNFYTIGHTGNKNAIVATFSANNYTLSNSNSSLSLDDSKLRITEVDNGWIKFTTPNDTATTNWIHLTNNKVDFGWKQIDRDGENSWFYFYSQDDLGGGMLTGWQEIKYGSSNQWFYLGNDGRMVTGTRVIDGDTYVFDSNGVCIQGNGCPRNPYP